MTLVLIGNLHREYVYREVSDPLKLHPFPVFGGQDVYFITTLASRAPSSRKRTAGAQKVCMRVRVCELCVCDLST